MRLWKNSPETNELVDKLSQKLNGDDKNAKLWLKNQEYLYKRSEFSLVGNKCAITMTSLMQKLHG